MHRCTAPSPGSATPHSPRRPSWARCSDWNFARSTTGPPGALGSLPRATKSGPVRFGLSGRDRVMVYRFAAETGLRANELRSSTWASFDLDGTPPTVTVKVAYSKHRREDVLPLKSATVAALAAWCGPAHRHPAGRLFGRLTTNTAKMLRADLDAARTAWVEETPDPQERAERQRSVFLSYRDHAGRVLDFHALRHTFISNLARGGVHPKQAMDPARHSDINLTMARYSDTVVEDLAAAVERLPELADCDRTTDAEVATGTYDGSAELRLPHSLPGLPAPGRIRASSRCIESEESQEPEVPQNDKKRPLAAVSRTSLHRLADLGWKDSNLQLPDPESGVLPIELQPK